jgi:hypothetical protein
MKIVLMLLISMGMAAADESSQWKSNDEMHKHYVKEFIKAPSFGASRVLVIDMDRFKTLTVDGKEYRVETMELLSVTDRKKPVMWQTGFKPNRSTLKNKNIKKRDLSDIEKKNLERMKQGSKFLTAKEGGTLSMMGVLRAEDGCIRCHEGYKVNDLMGAFKYTFVSGGVGPRLRQILKTPIKKETQEKKNKKEKEPEVG